LGIRSCRKEVDRVGLYLVDYDIPVEHRFKFYYEVRKALRDILAPFKDKAFKSIAQARALARELGIYVKSTQSVVLTNSYDIAETIYKIARQYGIANFYVCTPVNAAENRALERMRLVREAKEMEEREERREILEWLACKRE